MVEVDCLGLKADIDSLADLLDDYEIIKLNLFNQLKDACINWQDGNSIEFDDRVYLDKQEIDKFIGAQRSKKEILDYLYYKYSEIGNVVKCDLEGKENLYNKIDLLYNEASSIIREFDKVDRSFYYSEWQLIQRERSRMVEVKNKLSSIKQSVKIMFDKIEAIENEVNDKIKGLESIKISAFDFDIRGE